MQLQHAGVHTQWHLRRSHQWRCSNYWETDTKYLWWPHEEETVSVCHGCVFDIISQRLCYMTFFTITKLFREKEIAVNILFFSFLKLHVRVNILKVKKVKVHTSGGSSLPQKTLLVNSLPHKLETLWYHTTFPYHRFVCTCKKKKTTTSKSLPSYLAARLAVLDYGKVWIVYMMLS